MPQGVADGMKGLFAREQGWLQRLAVVVVLSLAMMVADHRGDYLERVRSVLLTATYPLQRAAALPPTLFGAIEQQLRSLSTVREENRLLRAEVQALRLAQQRFEATLRENQRLRALLDSASVTNERVQGAELIAVESTASRRLVTIDRGARHGVFRGQPVLDADGVLGQVLHVARFSSTVMLITDSRHALPVRIDRTGVLAVARGRHNSNVLELAFVPNNADLELGDMVVTSGLGGRFPEGYLVGRITDIDTHPGTPFARVTVAPEARLTSAREVLLIWPDTASDAVAAPQLENTFVPEPDGNPESISDAALNPVMDAESGEGAALDAGATNSAGEDAGASGDAKVDDETNPDVVTEQSGRE